MLKMKKKVFLGLFLILILVANMSFASYSTVQMSVVEEPVATIEFGSNSKFEKKLISKDLTNKEVTLQLQVTNGEASQKPTGEIVLVLDNSASMNDNITTSSGQTTRKQLIFDSAKKFITNLLKDNKDLKISVVSFSTNTEVSKEGTTEDAILISALSNNASTLTNAIDSIVANGARTDLEAGLDLASKQFSTENNNKYMVVLTDGVPNVSLGHNNPYYSDDTINATKAKLQSIEQKGIQLFTMLSGISDETYVPSGTTKSFGEIIKEVFGTASAPTAGKFLYVSDEKIEETINLIYSTLVPKSQTYKNIKVVDYFPKEIIDNFDFAYVEKANIGEVSAQVDTTNNSITWTIPELANGETATVQYKLKLKQNFDSNIVGKILKTNEKVDLTYDDFDGNKQEKTTDITPKLKLVEPPAQLPKAGLNTLVVSILVVVALAAFFFVRFKKLNDDIK